VILLCLLCYVVTLFCRFLDSEVELNDTVQEMHIIATTPELYNIVVELNTVQSLLQLLSHDNTGLCVSSVLTARF